MFGRNKTDLKAVSYDNHYRLFEHYSKLVFRARISIVTLILLVAAFVFKIKPEPASMIELGGDVSLNIVSVILFFTNLILNFMFWMEIGYTKRFYLVVSSVRDFVDEPPSFFSKDRFKGEARPMYFVYGLAVFIFSFASVVYSWGTLPSWLIILLAVFNLIPVLLFITGWHNYTQIQKTFEN
ncbi:hypothetical protein [Fulvivirga ligni]|uniref:hypothetical protein n=1 Tax=Fulvivirga ligni TaxID=2904246 RepID=UPI001F3AEC4D|nr:hypothetical protein [Fulvivirga ligni]UII21557.1 hypothetical protein LVD16_27395 [Fulvivirga ligni]